MSEWAEGGREGIMDGGKEGGKEGEMKCMRAERWREDTWY